MCFFIRDLGTGEETVQVEQTQIFVLPTAPLQVELHQVHFVLFAVFVSVMVNGHCFFFP